MSTRKPTMLNNFIVPEFPPDWQSPGVDSVRLDITFLVCYPARKWEITSFFQELTRALGQVRLHMFIQGYTLIFIPIVMTLLVYSLELTGLIDNVFLKG